MQCPHIDKHPVDETFNRRINYSDFGGEDYIFFDHDDGFGHITRVQFCKFIGRKRDVFQCFNESEWKACPHYRIHAVQERAAETEMKR